MKRLDLMILLGLAAVSLVLGGKLATSVLSPERQAESRSLSDITAFAKKADSQTGEGPHVYLLAQQWQWSPELVLKEGQDYILHLASADIQHAFHLEKAATGRSIDILIQPGREYLIPLKGLKEGAYAIGCTQYCGLEHNKMRSRLIVRK